jgi:hypothetical protein
MHRSIDIRTKLIAVVLAPLSLAATAGVLAAPVTGAARMDPAPAPVTVTVAATATAAGLAVYVGYAEDKEINNPDPGAFPVPWAGAPNTTVLGGTVPGQTACGTLTVCYDGGAIRLDNPTSAPITVSRVSADVHSAIPGGKLFNNLWGSFTVAPGKSVILAANPPANNPGYDNFDTSGYPSNNCTPITIAPTVTITVGGVATTLADSTHVIDTGGIDAGYCQPKHNESIQWRAIGTAAAGGGKATLSLGPATLTAPAGHPVTETATLLDGGGGRLPNTTVNFTVTSGPDAGAVASAVTDASGDATFTLPGARQGEDVVIASVTTVGTFTSNQSRVIWTDGTAANWNAADIGSPALAGSQSFALGTGAWTIGGSGTGTGGSGDQFHYIWQTGAGVAAHVTSQTATGPSAEAGAMVRASTDPGAPFYAAFVSPGGIVKVRDRTTRGGATTTIASVPGSGPAYLWIVGNGTGFTAYTSADGYDWMPIAGSAVTLNLGTSPLAGLAVTSGDPAVVNTAVMDTVALPADPPGPALPEPCPAPWTCADIGSPTPAGSQSFDPNTATWTIAAGGTDITGTSDEFRYVLQTLTANGSVIARVVSQTDSSSAAKAGVMFRTSTDPAAPNYAVVVSPGQGIKVQVRKIQGGGTTKLANPTGAAPVYVKITRSGSTFTAYTSADGITWTLIPGSTSTVNLGASMLAGLAATSHNSGALSTVVMNGVAVG